MQANESLQVLRSLAVDLASEIDLHYTTRELTKLSPIIEHLREAFHLLEQVTGEQVPARQIVDLHDDQVKAEADEGDLDQMADDPMFGSIRAFRLKPALSDEQYVVICTLLAEFSRHLYANADDSMLREEWTGVSAIEEARRMLYAMDRRVPLEVEQLLARHFKLMLETTIARRH